MNGLLDTFWPILGVVSAIFDKFWMDNLGSLSSLGNGAKFADFLVCWGRFSPASCSGQLEVVGTGEYFRFFGQRLRIGEQQY
jgi:hypothetical protein